MLQGGAIRWWSNGAKLLESVFMNTKPFAQHMDRWRKHAVQLLRREGEALPPTVLGRRIPQEACLEATEAMRDFKEEQGVENL